MDVRLIKYLKSLKPNLDIYGRWMMFIIPRTASGSMTTRALDHYFVKRRMGSRRQQSIRRKQPFAHVNWDLFFDQIYAHCMNDVFKFTFVRNPWDRIISAFFYLIKRNELDPSTDFNHYVKSVLDEKWPNVPHFYFPQSNNFMFEGRPFDIFVGRFENLQRDWEYVAKKLHVNPYLSRANITVHDHYSTYYNDESIEIIRKLYKEEIKYLGYEFARE